MIAEEIIQSQPDLRRFCEGVLETIRAAGPPTIQVLLDVERSLYILAEAFRDATSAFAKFTDAAWACICEAYLLEHKRLPGSRRTRRLRKKRLTVVFHWIGKRRT